MDLQSMKPLGERTTVLDLADREELDDWFFPTDADFTFFTRNEKRRTLPFTSTVQEFPYQGTSGFGGRVVFTLNGNQACDILLGTMVQIKLGHWLPPDIQRLLLAGKYAYKTPDQSWHYANSLGTTLIEKAEFMLEDQILETIDSVYTHIFSCSNPDINTQIGLATDAYGRKTIPDLLAVQDSQIYPNSSGILTCVLPFSYMRTLLKNGFPLMSVKENTIRIAITFRPFSQVVRVRDGRRATCDETPLGKTIEYYDRTVPWWPGIPTSRENSTVVPAFEDIRLLTYGVLVDGQFRKALLYSPFERPYREVQRFVFSEPLKYTVNKKGDDTISVQLPLELNNPVEEIFWIVRRKAVDLNNEWTNFSGILESEYDATYNPLDGLLVGAEIQMNGTTVVSEHADYFRQHYAEKINGGIVSYKNYIYGYTFYMGKKAYHPTGWINASRSTDIRLRLNVKPPTGLENAEWEVYVYAHAINWVRFENGIANKVFSS